jgi:hypothetical protein
MRYPEFWFSPEFGIFLHYFEYSKITSQHPDELKEPMPGTTPLI